MLLLCISVGDGEDGAQPVTGVYCAWLAGEGRRAVGRTHFHNFF
jgi:hypothetical protein